MKNKKTEGILRTAVILIAGVLIGVTANINAQSWSNPTAAPTGNNAYAPINASSSDQYKAGGLALGKSSNPASGIKLDVSGAAVINTLGVINMVISTGTPVAGKVLTATDNMGTVAWKALTPQDIPAATTAILETKQFKWPCPPKIMKTGPPETVYLPDFSGSGVIGDAKDSACGTGRLYADNSGNNQDVTSLHAFCQSVGYQAYMTATFYSFDSPGNNKVIKYEPASTAESKFRFFQASDGGNNHIAQNVTCQRITTATVYSPDLR
jgi:hypothetical protein